MTDRSAPTFFPVPAAILLAAACSSPPPTNAIPAPPGPAAATTAADATMHRSIYDVRDLVFASRPDAEPVINLPDLAQKLKDETDPAYWDREGTALVVEEAGYLIITAEGAMHAKVAQVLRELRQLVKR